MLPWFPRLRCFAVISLLGLVSTLSAEVPAPFFEPDQPFYQTQVQIARPTSADQPDTNFAVRGILIPLGEKHVLAFDQDLLRIAGIWSVPARENPITPATMAQASYVEPRRKATSEHPQPTGLVFLSTTMHPGVGPSVEGLFIDPRPSGGFREVGRGPLPVALGRFDGIETAGPSAMLLYHSGTTAIREWFTSRGQDGEFECSRHLEVAAHRDSIHIAVGSIAEHAWALSAKSSPFPRANAGERVDFGVNSEAVSLSIQQGELIVTLAPAARVQRVTLTILFHAAPAGPGSVSRSTPLIPSPTPPPPVASGEQRWPQSVTAPVQLGAVSQNGFLVDQIAAPEENPWHRHIRAADLAFLDENRAAVVTYDGDVWILAGLADPQLKRLTWRRFAAGLHEPLAIVAPNGVIQVATKNGVVRLFDRDGNGEADWYENFSDLMLQSQTTRSFPLDMAMAPDGSTYVTQGGIVEQSGMAAGGRGNSQSGGILKISRDGRSAELIAAKAREPFVIVHPKTGVVTATDQQGHFIPSSATYLIRPGDSFGFMEEKPTKLTPPLAWIPHEQDTSSTSEVWMIGSGMGPWNGRLLHLSYGTGRFLLISPDLDAPVPQAAVIPLEFKTDFPLLHARMHPRGDAVFFAGLQIYGTRAKTLWGLGRLRPGPTPITTALGARSFADGVILEFAEPIDPSSLRPEKVSVRGWNYFRSSAYGSGRYKLGAPPTANSPAGTTGIGIAQLVLSADRRSVFVHLPQLPAMMQLEVAHNFTFASGHPARGAVYFTINQPRTLDLATLGFSGVDLNKRAGPVIEAAAETPTVQLGRSIAENMGCAACHSADGTTEGKVGPTWKWLYRSNRRLVDGSVELADEFYIREKILDPMKRRVTTGTVEMPSYRGVLSESQIDAVILYIKSLAHPRILKAGSPDDVPPESLPSGPPPITPGP